MLPSSVRILNAGTTQLAATINGAEWTDITCHLENGSIIIDGVGEIPDAVREWIAAGGVPEPYVPPMPTEAAYSAAIQAHVDTVAGSLGYADGVACVSYHNSANTVWASEAQTFSAWRDAVWLYAYTQLAAVQSNQRPQPTVSGLVAELPAIAWPS